jgi:hypothetical protein
MRFLGLCVLLICLAPSGSNAEATRLELAGYQDQRGAMTVHHQGDFVDPYFAIKALLAAHHAGLDIRGPAQDWISWLLPRQEPNGLFQRFCDQHGEWLACKRADADDALLALWIELLYVVSPDDGLPPQWQASVQKAQRQLDLLLDRRQGIYHISADHPVGLFMDNVEIYAALWSVGREQKRMKSDAAARETLRRATALRSHIERIFHPRKNRPYLVSTQDSAEWRFYPEALAQAYPWLHRMPVSGKTPRAGLHDWLETFGAKWLSFTKDHYPWGLVALAAFELGECEAAQRWIEQAVFLRHGDRWNVLEEAAFQSIHKLASTSKASCTKRPHP